MPDTPLGDLQRVHMIGIGGAGMSGIAEVLLGQGYSVSGSDLADNPHIQRLKQLGAQIALGHDPANLAGCELVVVSSAVAEDNPELQAAHAQRLPVVPRAQMLAELMRGRFGIAVAGTHGKTTTTCLVASVFAAAELDPTYVIGGQLNHTTSHARLGASDYLIVEADESDASFLCLHPKIAVITNLSADHMATYGADFNRLREAFLTFIHQLPLDGLVVLGIDDPQVAALLPEVGRPVLTFGLSDAADVRATALQVYGLQTQFTLHRPDHADLPITLNLPGEHNVQNALAALAVATHLQLADQPLQIACAEFSGVGRRFQVQAAVEFAGRELSWIDDYGHHPRELLATLRTIKQVWPERRLVWCFQPHRYSRVAALFDEFVIALASSAKLILLPIYAASEAPMTGVSSESLAAAIRQRSDTEVTVLETLEQLPAQLAAELKDGDVVLCQGAGDIHALSQGLLQAEMVDG